MSIKKFCDENKYADDIRVAGTKDVTGIGAYFVIKALLAIALEIAKFRRSYEDWEDNKDERACNPYRN